MIISYMLGNIFELLKALLELFTDPVRINFIEQIYLDYVDILCDNLGLIDIIIPIRIAKFLVKGMILLGIAKFAYSFAMFIIHKIPFVNIR